MPKTAIVVDDLASDRRNASRVLLRRGWQVHLARNSAEGLECIQQVLATHAADEVIVITDLNMPRDPATHAVRQSTAGANFALQLRTHMEQQRLPRLPIIALTALTEHEVHLTAIAFGCDAVLEKPATPDLPERIAQALERSNTSDSDPVGAAALLRLLRQRLANETHIGTEPAFTESDVTRALLCYRRQGLIGLGQSNLAQRLLPLVESALQRGELLYKRLLEHLQAIIEMDVLEALEVLQGEIIEALSPSEQCERLAISSSEYYRRRREAIRVLFEVMSEASPLD